MKEKVRSTYIAVFTTILIFCTTGMVKAQMFSVQTEQTTRMDIPRNTFLIGYEPTTFTFRNDVTDNIVDLSFSDPVYRVRAEVEGFQAYAGMGFNLGDNNDINYFNAGGKIDGEFRFAGSPSYYFAIPLILMTDYLQVISQDESQRASEFRQSAASVGIGISFGARLTRQFRVESRVIPTYGFSVTSFGATGGARSSLIAQNRVYMDHLFGRIGLTAGFDYHTARYNMDDERFNYDLSSNSFVIGITF